jgi:hypothetical protein
MSLPNEPASRPGGVRPGSPLHGRLTSEATEPEWNGYLLTVACPCAVVFERWVTPEEAAADLLGLAGLN